MRIDRMRLQNFTAFQDLEIKLSPKINVIIGENSTGKTNLLKAGYFMSGGAVASSEVKIAEGELSERLAEKMKSLFLPIDDRLGKLSKRGETGDAKITVHFDDQKVSELSFHANSTKHLKITGDASNLSTPEGRKGLPVFIPTKEVLAFMKGFQSLYKRYELSFDRTYYDICSLLDLPKMRKEVLHLKSNWAMEEIEKICGGKFIFKGGGIVTFVTDKDEFSANETAEGFRKLGILSRLLETGVINPGQSGPLFWDEPDVNLNPLLMKKLVEILYELSRLGQQFVVSTHNYLLIKWIDILFNKEKEDYVVYHSLYRDRNTREVSIKSTLNFNDIEPNPIDEAFGDIISSEIEKEMGGLGK